MPFTLSIILVVLDPRAGYHGGGGGGSHWTGGGGGNHWNGGGSNWGGGGGYRRRWYSDSWSGPRYYAPAPYYVPNPVYVPTPSYDYTYADNSCDCDDKTYSDCYSSPCSSYMTTGTDIIDTTNTWTINLGRKLRTTSKAGALLLVGGLCN